MKYILKFEVNFSLSKDSSKSAVKSLGREQHLFEKTLLHGLQILLTTLFLLELILEMIKLLLKEFERSSRIHWFG